LTLMDPQTFVTSPLSWLTVASERSATVSCAPNVAFDLVARRLRRTQRPIALDRLRVIITGSEPVRADTLRSFEDVAIPLGLPETAICPAYGLAEASLAVTMTPPAERWRSQRIDRRAAADAVWQHSTQEDALELVSAGRQLRDMTVRAPSNAIGTVEIAGPSLMSGYLVDGRRSEQGRWFATSDLGALVDSELYLTGRSDDVIIVGGRNIYAPDIEAIAATHGEVRGLNCGAIQDDGEGRYAVIAEARPGVEAADLRRAAARIRADIARAWGTGPSVVGFVPSGSLPKTPSGKLQRKHLRSLYLDDGIEFEAVSKFGASGIPR
jgi:acyl-CoA synthetase (AMP-forming)/AMP-acid ligase II